MQPIRNIAITWNWIGSGGAAPVSITPRSTTTDWVDTAAISQAPLIPRASVGLRARTVTAVKKVYMIANHSYKFSAENVAAYLRAANE